MKLEKIGKQEDRSYSGNKVIIGALGTVTKHFEKWVEKLDLNLMIEALQKLKLETTWKIKLGRSKNLEEVERSNFKVVTKRLFHQQVKIPG